MFKTVATIRILTLLLALSLPAFVFATDITCSVTGANPYCGGSSATVNYNGTPITFNAGNIFKVELSDASGSFSSPVVIGSISGTAPTGSIPINFPAAASGTNYRVRITASDPSVIGTDNGSNLTINPATNTSVSIGIDKSGAILCDTHTATFTATPTPNVASSYAWTRNGTPVGINSSIYTASDFNDGDAVKVTMTSSATCPLPAAAVSNTIVIIQKATVAPSVSIAGPSVVCAGNNATFNATPTNGGATPSYQWKRNGNAVGINSPSFVTNSLISGDVLLVEMTSNRECISPATTTSNNIDISVSSVVTPTIAITADPGTAVGTGSTVYISSSITGGGSAPTYDWKKNGVSVGNSSVLVIPTAANNDQIVATLTSNANCAQPTVVNSKPLILTVNDNMTQSNHAWDARTPQSDVSGMIARINASGFSIGTKGYVGVGYVGSTSTPRKDFWEYDPVNDTWAQKADFGGAARYNAVGFSVGNKGYIGMGVIAGGTTVKDLYQYDPTTNSWISRVSLPGQVREQAFAFSIGAKGYVGGGYATGFGDFNDFYEYDPSSNSWAAKASFGGGKRLGGATFSVDAIGKGFVAGGYSTTSTTWFKDLWDYDQVANVWTQRADMPGNGRSRATGFALAGNGYVGLGNTSGGYDGQMFKYTVSSNTWSYKPYYPGPQTSNQAIGMSIGNRAFVYKDGTLTEYNLFITSPFSSKICTSEIISISFDASGFTFNTGNVFSVQICSDRTFKNAVVNTLGTYSSTASNGTVNAAIPGNYAAGNYYMRITSVTPSIATLPEPVTVTTIPATQTITSPGGATVCKDVSITFNSSLTGTGFQWYKNNVAVGTDSPNYTDNVLVNGDVIKAIKTYIVGCSQPTGVNSNTISMTVRAPVKPVVTVTQPNTLVSTNGIAYQWYKDGDAINKATNQTYVMSETGVYKVRTSDSQGCLAFSDDLANAFTGLYDETIANQINTYPNPVKGDMVLEVSDDLVTQGVDYTVLNELGQPVINSQKAFRSNKINLSGRASGLYLVRLSINGSTVIRRVVKVD